MSFPPQGSGTAATSSGFDPMKKIRFSDPYSVRDLSDGFFTKTLSGTNAAANWNNSGDSGQTINSVRINSTGNANATVDIISNMSATPAKNPKVASLSFLRGTAGGSDVTTMRFGLGNAATWASSNHYAVIESVVSGTSSTSLTAKSKDGTTEETTSLTVGTVFNSTRFYAIEVSTASVKFYVDGELVATHSTNIPNATLTMLSNFTKDSSSDGGNGYIEGIYMERDY